MEPATEKGSGSDIGCCTGLTAGAGRDWSRLPEDLLVSVLRELHVADAVRSGAVCTSWNAAYATFRRFRVPSPRQPPCLLYASDAVAPGAAALHCPATGATRQIPFPLVPLAQRPLLGSGHGWLVTADEASDLHLLNPVTGAQVALPPITALHHVERGTDEQGDPAYLVYENLCGEYNRSKNQYEIDTAPTILEIDRAHDYMYYRVAISASPSAGRDCVVLLLHMPYGEISFARVGDERWTWVAPETGATGLPWTFFYDDIMYSDVHGLFYVLGFDASMYSLDLHGPTPVAAEVLPGVPKSLSNQTRYLVQTPGGDILQVWRRRTYVDLLTPVVLPPNYDDDGDMCHDPTELVTIDVQLYKVDLHGQRLDMIKSLPDCALFLGMNGSMCLPVRDFPGLKPDCAYVTDDFLEYVNMLKYNPREVGIWSMAEQTMSRLDVSPVVYPWLNWPSPIWIKPSFF